MSETQCFRSSKDAQRGSLVGSLTQPGFVQRAVGKAQCACDDKCPLACCLVF